MSVKISALTPISPVPISAETVIVSSGVTYRATIADVLGALTGNPGNIAGFNLSTGKISDLGFSAAAFASSTHNHDTRYPRYDAVQTLNSTQKTQVQANLGLGTMAAENATDYYNTSDADGLFATLAATNLLAIEFSSIAADLDNHLTDVNNPHLVTLQQVSHTFSKTVTFDAAGFPLSSGIYSPIIRVPASYRLRRWRIFGDAGSGMFSTQLYTTTVSTWPTTTLLTSTNVPQLVAEFAAEYVFGVSDYILFASETLILLYIASVTGPYTNIQITLDFEAY